MYDVQTILSAYDKQGTLVQWLKNLGKTLKESGLESVEVNEVENGVKLVFKFAGGTTIESPVIEKLKKLDLLADSVQLAYESVNGITVEYNANITANDEGINGTINILLPIKGSESVVVDVSEDNTSIQIHLDADILNDISRSLKTPLARPTETELVAVGNTGEQVMLNIGDGLSIENGALKASGGGSGGSTGSSVKVFSLNDPEDISVYAFFDDWVTNPQNYGFLITRNGLTLLYTLAKKQTGLYSYQACYNRSTTANSCVIDYYILYITTSGSITYQPSQTLYLPYQEQSGLQVNQITFTDRSSCETWLQQNYARFLKAVAKSNLGSDLYINTIAPRWRNDALYGVSLEIFNINILTTSIEFICHQSIFDFINHTYATSTNTSLVEISTDSTSTASTSININTPNIVPDEMWAQLGIELTIFYV